MLPVLVGLVMLETVASKDLKNTKRNVLTSTIFETKIRESPYVSKAD